MVSGILKSTLEVPHVDVFKSFWHKFEPYTMLYIYTNKSLSHFTLGFMDHGFYSNTTSATCVNKISVCRTLWITAV